MKKKTSRIIAFTMLIFAIIFVAYALNNPQASFPWGNNASYSLFVVYFGLMEFFFIAPFK